MKQGLSKDGNSEDVYCELKKAVDLKQSVIPTGILTNFNV
jgi:hypothetical protein